MEEANLAIGYGAAAIGLVSAMPSGPGVIPDELIFEIARQVPPSIDTFLLTSQVDATNIIRHHAITQTNTIQLVDEVPEETYAPLRMALPSTKLVQVIHVIDERSVEEAIRLSPYVDAILLDSGNPKSAVKELGGTGRVHNWKLSRKIRDNISVPVYLAGGLNMDNARRAIEEVQPFGLDLCSGVRTDGKLDEKKLDGFFRQIR